MRSACPCPAARRWRAAGAAEAAGGVVRVWAFRTPATESAATLAARGLGKQAAPGGGWPVGGGGGGAAAEGEPAAPGGAPPVLSQYAGKTLRRSGSLT